MFLSYVLYSLASVRMDLELKQRYARSIFPMLLEGFVVTFFLKEMGNVCLTQQEDSTNMRLTHGHFLCQVVENMLF